MTRTLVTGATGFVGRHVVASLTRAGHQVVTVGRTRPTGAGVDFIEANLLEMDGRRRAVARAGAERLVHLAWIADPGVYWRSPLNLDWVAASLDLVKRFQEGGGTRAVAIGTCAEYEWGAARLDEVATPCRPATLYGTAKDATRRVLSAFAAETGLSFAWARLFFIYGPGERSGRLVSDAIGSLRAGRPFPTSEGRQRRDYLHVADVADAIVALLDSVATGPVNVASGRAVAVRDLLETLAAQLGNGDRLQFGARPAPVGDPAIIEGDARRLTEEVGFAPRFDLASGLADTLRRAQQP